MIIKILGFQKGFKIFGMTLLVYDHDGHKLDSMHVKWGHVIMTAHVKWEVCFRSYNPRSGDRWIGLSSIIVLF